MQPQFNAAQHWAAMQQIWKSLPNTALEKRIVAPGDHLIVTSRQPAHIAMPAQDFSSHADPANSTSPQVIKVVSHFQSKCIAPVLDQAGEAGLVRPSKLKAQTAVVVTSKEKPDVMEIDDATRKALKAAGLGSKKMIRQVIRDFRRLGIPLNDMTAPVGRREGFMTEIGAGFTSEVYRVSLKTDTGMHDYAFKPATGRAGLAAQVANINLRRPNLEGRHLLASYLGETFLPSTCAAKIPDTRLMYFNGELGLMAALAPHEKFEHRSANDQPLKKNSPLYATLMRAKEQLLANPAEMESQLKLLGLHCIRFFDDDVFVTGAFCCSKRASILHQGQARRALTWLHLIDLMSGQMDRHSGNILIHAHFDPVPNKFMFVFLCGIDNDQCFGTLIGPAQRREKLGVYRYFCCDYPDVIDTEMATAASELDTEEIEDAAWSYLNNEREVHALLECIKGVKSHCAALAAAGKVIGVDQWESVPDGDPENRLASRELRSLSEDLWKSLNFTRKSSDRPNAADRAKGLV